MSDEVAEEDPAWSEACRREDEAVRTPLLRYPDRLNRRAVEDVAGELRLSRATLYRLIARYRAARTVEAWIERPPGRPKGSLHDEPTRDALIQQFLERESASWSARAAPSAQAGGMHCIRSAAHAHTPDALEEVRGQSHSLRQS